MTSFETQCAYALQTVSQLPTKLESLYASYTSALEGLQSVLPLQYTAEELCARLDQQVEGTQMMAMSSRKE